MACSWQWVRWPLSAAPSPAGRVGTGSASDSRSWHCWARLARARSCRGRLSRMSPTPGPRLGPQPSRPTLPSDAVSQTTDAFFFCAFVVMGLYLATLAAAILTGGVYARWIGWACAASAPLMLAGDFLTLASEVAFFAVLLGFLLFMAVLIALGVTMWQQAEPSTSAAEPSVAVTGRDFA